MSAQNFLLIIDSSLLSARECPETTRTPWQRLARTELPVLTRETALLPLLRAFTLENPAPLAQPAYSASRPAAKQPPLVKI